MRADAASNDHCLNAFVLAGERVIAEFGIGLAAAVAIDAFLLRAILVPRDDAPDRAGELVAAPGTV